MKDQKGNSEGDSSLPASPRNRTEGESDTGVR